MCPVNTLSLGSANFPRSRGGNFSHDCDDGGVHYISDTAPIMQYTGLKDKNGVEIFESDILKMTAANGKVIFDNGCFYIWEMAYGAVPPKHWNPTWEVIGNIHENPELLED